MNFLVRNVKLRLVHFGIFPRSGMARFTLWVAGLWCISEILALVLPASKGSGFFSGWARLFEFIFFVCAIWLLFRWMRKRLLWRLRNRLIVTYVFIGVIPVVLILTMFGIAGYLLGNQLTTMLVNKDLNAEVRELDTLNSTISLEIAGDLAAHKKAPLHLAAWPADGSMKAFPQAAVAAWVDGKRLELAGVPAPPPDQQDNGKNYSGVIAYGQSFLLRSFKTRTVAGQMLQVAIVVPVQPQLLASAVPDLGEVTLYSLMPARRNDGAQISVNVSDENDKKQKNFAPAVKAGVYPAAQYSFDPRLIFGSALPTTNWSDGKKSTALVQVNTRASVLFQRLFTDLGEVGSAYLVALAVVATAFALIELVALIIGVSLTRTITGSISQLYRATQRINRGDLKHRINVRSHDQLASLETSFNSMTQSLERLLEEQKEKERLQNELAIAQEVQAQLFPRDPKPLKTLELHGVCKPARTVSGDYYDFIASGEERLGIAVGDISGKGISAALLMATIHSAVRVFELGNIPEHAELVAAGAAAVASAANISAPRWSIAAETLQSPAEVLSLLNRHLYQSTPPEKYATLFLAMYDGNSRTLTYSNGGHLPPFVIHDSGEVRKLDQGGLVIGLFPEIVLDQEEVQLSPGDIFLAFSDGVTEPENEFGEFGEERLLQLVRSNRHLALARISEIVMTAVQDWIGENEQPDDVTLVLARVQ
jgi:phosphoserine phosphatase RsbU/P